MASSGYHQDALPIFSEIIRTPFISPSIAFRARLSRARTFLKMARSLKATSAQDGEFRPKIGVDISTWCEMAQSDLEELIRSYSSSSFFDDGTENDDHNEKEEKKEGASLLERVYVTRVEAADILGDEAAKRRFVISGLCEFPNSEKLRSFLEIKKSTKEEEESTADDEKNIMSKPATTITTRKSDQEQSSSSALVMSSGAEINPGDLQLECAICQNIFIDPISIACGHNFCRSCLASTMDHSSAHHPSHPAMFGRGGVLGGGGGQIQKCPLCRVPLHIDVETFPVNLVLQHIVQTLFPSQYRERRREMNGITTSNNNSSSSSSSSSTAKEFSLPLFVCNSTSPGHQIAFNIFEPRYRLMFRRIIRGSREFGLLEGREVSSENEQGANGNDASMPFYPVGTLIRVTDSVIQPDGRIMVSGVAVKRIKVKSNVELDGYRVGVCENYEDDDPRSGEEAVAAATACRLLAKKMLEKFAENPRLPKAPPFCTELLAAPVKKNQNHTTEDEKKSEEEEEEEKAEEDKQESSSSIVDEKWAQENFHRVIVPCSLWLGEFFYQASWQNLLLTNTAQRLKLCLSMSSTQGGNAAMNFLSSAASFFQSSILGRVFGLNNNNNNNNS